MRINRRDLLVSIPVVSAALATNARPAAAYTLPANKNVKWAVSTNIWDQSKAPFTEVLDDMKETGFIGIRLRGFPHILERWGLTQAQLHNELSKRNLSAVTISFDAPLHDPQQRQQVLDSAREAVKFLSDFGANHLVVFSPGRKPETSTPAAFKEMCERCNQIGELAGEMGFSAGLHNHLGEMVQTQEEVDRFMDMTDPELFGLSPDTAHLDLAGCDVVQTLNRYKNRIHFLDYKDAKRDGTRFRDNIYDLGDGEIDFPACHRILKSVEYRGWVCVDLDTARLGPLEDYKRCGDYVVNKLQPIYL
jgi:sugar phosphate isomerase/epimerase